MRRAVLVGLLTSACATGAPLPDVTASADLDAAALAVLRTLPRQGYEYGAMLRCDGSLVAPPHTSKHETRVDFLIYPQDRVCAVAHTHPRTGRIHEDAARRAPSRADRVFVEHGIMNYTLGADGVVRVVEAVNGKSRVRVVASIDKE